MVKKVKKSSKKSKQSTPKRVVQEEYNPDNFAPPKRFEFLKFLAIALAVLIVLGAVFFLIKQFLPGLLGSSLSGKLAATVNGKEITMEKLDNDYASLPAQYQLLLTKEALLDQLIEQELLTQEAAKLGINPTQEEIQANIDDFISQYNMTQEELNALLANKSMTQKDLEDISREQLISKAIIEIILKDTNVTTEEALTYYNEHKSSFEVPEEFVARHIMFATALTNRTTEQAHSEALSVLKLVKPDKSNFCILVTQYSDDKRSVPDCGQYTFSTGQMPPEFENWITKAKIGDIAVVNTEYGSHIILYVNKTAKKIYLFKDVQSQIISALKSQKEKTAYQNYVDNLKKNAVIVNYLKKDTATDNSMIDDQTNTQDVPMEETPAVETQPIVETKPVETTPVETKPTTTTTTVNVESNGFSKCFLSKTPVLYGAQWDSTTMQQKSQLGDSLSQITYVECFAKGEYKTPLKVCSDLKITAYPTWRVGSQTILGIHSMKEVEALAGC